jgi:DNA-binding NarL/FixJ family response regulator
MVDSRSLLGVGVRVALEHELDIEVVGQVNSVDEAVPVVHDEAPDVILVNAPLNEPIEAEAARRLHRSAPDSAMVVLGGEDDDASILGAIAIGAAGHVAELAQPAELVATIRRVADGEDPLKDELTARPDLVDRIVDGVRGTILETRQPSPLLTIRELDVLRLVAIGMRNREIAQELGISQQTIKNHITSILHKIGAPNRTRAVTYAVRQGWLGLGEVTDLAAPSGRGPSRRIDTAPRLRPRG